jgi:hypothetical protein
MVFFYTEISHMDLPATTAGWFAVIVVRSSEEVKANPRHFAAKLLSPTPPTRHPKAVCARVPHW